MAKKVYTPQSHAHESSLPVGRFHPLQPDEADTHNESERAH